MDFSIIDLATFVGFILLVIGVSLWAGRKEETSEDYFLAGRGLTWWMIGLSLIASNISTEHFVGMAGQGYMADIGLAIASYEWIAALSLIIVALFLLPRFLRSGIYTIPEFLEYRYNKWPRMIMGFGLLFMYAGVTMATVLYAGALAMNTIFDIDMTVGVWVIGAIAGLYTVYGGLKAVVWSDVLQGTALLIGGVIVTFLAMDAVGGWDSFVQMSSGRLHTVLPADHPELPWTAVFVGGMWLPNIFYWGLNQFITQRTLAAKSLAEGQKGVLFGASLKLIMPMIVVFPGIIAFELYADQIPNADLAYPTLLKNLLPTGLIGIMFAALFGATMSTLDSLLNSAATIFTIDFYKPLIKSDGDSKHYIRVGQVVTIVFVIISCLCAPFVANFQDEGLYKYIQMWWGSIQPGIVAAFFLGLFSNKISPVAVTVGMLANIPIYLLMRTYFPETSFLHHMAYSFCYVSLIMMVISAFKPDTREITYPVNEGYDMKPSRTVLVWSALIFLSTVALYWFFR
ncbi:MAG: solute:sodium symporter family transporter [Flavobacteriales bacterium]|nr:solute:sodium symporter family transporter [Flavobacteriales bacterium]